MLLILRHPLSIDIVGGAGKIVTLPPAFERSPYQLDESSQSLFEFALPDRHHEPSIVDECLLVLFVSFSVAGDFGLPIGGVFLGAEVSGALLAAVPEATVDEETDLGFSENDVGRPR